MLVYNILALTPKYLGTVARYLGTTKRKTKEITVEH